MIKKLLSTLAFLTLVPLSFTAQTVSTEDFETETGSSTSFTDNGQVFNITTQAQGPFDIQTAYPGTGWNGTAVDNRYIDNDGFAVAGFGTGFTISSSGAVPFNIKSVWMYLADNTANVNVSGTLTIVGKLGGTTKFTVSATSPFNNTSVGTNNGYTLIDFTTFGGSNNASTNIDQLVFTTTTNFTYVALDAFKWSTTCPSVSVSSLSQTNVSCNGGSNGAASVSASGGSGFTYNWTPGNPTGDGTASVTGLTAGNWTCTVTNSCGNSNSTSFSITQPSAISSNTVSVTNVSCNGGSNGAATISASGGTGTLTYAWSPSPGAGQGTASISGLSAQNYTCTITDANSCTKTQTVSISQPSAISSNTVSVTNVSCNGGSNGAASITASGGAGSFTYNWTPGNPTGDGTTSVSGLTAGTWTCTITDANSCTKTQTVSISQPAAISSNTVSVTNVSCNGGSNGAASISASGGTGTLTYAWSPSPGAGQGTASISGLSAQNYTCTITDANSCTKTQTVSISQPAAISSNTVSVTNVSCNGGSNGAASISASGGAGSFTYNWTPGNPTGDGTTSVTGLTAGNWTCTITDANSCTKTQTVSVTQPTVISATTTQTNVACNGGSNGIASVSASGGTGGYTYSWAPSGGTGASATGLSANNYTCTITDANSCSITKTFNLTQPSAITATTTQTNVACNGGSNGIASVSASGGTGAYTYSWTPSGGTGASASGLAATNYTCTIKDGNNCSITKTFTINQPSVLNLSVASQTNVSTFGGNDGAAAVNASSGGTPGYSYNWTPGNPTGDGSTTVSNLTAGTWTCTVTDGNNCSAVQTFTITQPAAGPAAALNFDGNDDLAKSNNSLNTIFAASNKITLEAWVNPSNNNYLGCIVGNYQTTNSGMQFLLRRDYNDYVFWIDNGSGFQNVVVTNGVALNTWTHLAGTWDGSLLKIYVNGVLAATNTVTGTNFASSNNDLWFGGNTAGTPEMFAGSIDEVRIWNRALCQGEIQNSMNAELMVPQSGLVAYYRLNQGLASANNAGVTVAADSSGNANNATLNSFALNGASSNWIAPGAVTPGNYAGNYTFPTACINSVAAVCENQAINLTSCSSGAATYSWSGPASFTSTQASPSIANASLSNDGTYTLSVTDANGCSASTTASVTVNPVPVVNTLSGNVTLCGDVSATFSISTAGISTYQWIYESVAPLLFDSAAINGSYTEVGYNTPTLTIQQVLTGNYDHYAVYCIVTNSYNCSTVSAPDTIYANPLPTVIASVTSPTLCLGFNDTLSVTGASTYTWSSNAGSTVNDTAFVSPTVSDTYTVTGVDTNGCSNTDVISITVNNCGSGVRAMNLAQLNVYPNPNNGTFSISAETEIGAVQIFNALGAEVYKATINNNHAFIDLGNQPAGLYHLYAQGRKVTISKQ